VGGGLDTGEIEEFPFEARWKMLAEEMACPNTNQTLKIINNYNKKIEM
jgi:L-rhamnose isomerase